MAKYRLTNKADSDLASHYEYGIENFGLVQAQSYMLGFLDHFEELAGNPSFGRSAEELAPDLHRLEYGSHVIFYLPEAEGILIVRILRKEMDFPRHF